MVSVLIISAGCLLTVWSCPVLRPVSILGNFFLCLVIILPLCLVHSHYRWSVGLCCCWSFRNSMKYFARSFSGEMEAKYFKRRQWAVCFKRLYYSYSLFCGFCCLNLEHGSQIEQRHWQGNWKQKNSRQYFRLSVIFVSLLLASFGRWSVS